MTKIENSIKSCSSNFNSKTGGTFMKRILVVMLLACVVLLLTSCFDFEPLPDMENGIVKLKIRNPNYGITTAAIPGETDSFVVLVKDFSGSSPLVFKDSFGNKEFIEISIKIPGGKNYAFYLMGRATGRMTCFGSVKNVLIPSGESIQLEIQMKSIGFSCAIEGSASITYTFKEPKYGFDEARNVKWAREYYLFTYTGEGLGNFFGEANNTSFYVYTGYEFDIWNGKQYFLDYYEHWYPSTGNIYSISVRFKKIDSNTMQAKVPIYFPLSYKDDGNTYKYSWGEFTFYVPIDWGSERVSFIERIPFSELEGDVQIIIE